MKKGAVENHFHLPDPSPTKKEGL